jgi:hypothetical protein
MNPQAISMLKAPRHDISAAYSRGSGRDLETRAPQLAFGVRNALPISILLWAALLSPLIF